jgi:broad specificity phosphatase PhoE
MTSAVFEAVRLARATSSEGVLVVSHQAPIGVLRATLERPRALAFRTTLALVPWPFVAAPSALGSVTELELDGDRAEPISYWVPPPVAHTGPNPHVDA